MTKITAKSGTSTQTMCIGNNKIKHVDNIDIIELCKKHGAEVYRPDDMGDDITFQYDQLAGLLDDLRAQGRREVLEEAIQIADNCDRGEEVWRRLIALRENKHE